MKKIISIIAIVMFVNNAIAQTEVSGDQTGTWTAINSPYNVIGEISIPSGQVLNIEPGVEVNFQGYYKFVVNGNLQAIGTESDSIFFTTDNQSIGWGGIRFDGSGVSNMTYCRIEFGKSSGEYPDNLGGAVALLTTDAVFSNCVFADNDASANDSGSGGAVYAINTGSLTVFSECVFLRNHAYGEGGAIKYTADNGSKLIDCVFFENTCNYGGGAISFYSVFDTKVTNCLFAYNYTMYSSGGAIHTLGFSNVIDFENCTMYSNYAVTGDGGAVNLVYTTATFVNCIITENPGAYSDDVFLDLGGSAEINYSNLAMPDGASGANNINVDPLFVDADNYDFHLLESSSCIDAGTDIGLEFVGEAPDMGCYEYGISTGIDQNFENSFSFFPNPTTGKLFIENQEMISGEIQIIDINGRVVLEQNGLSQNSTIDLSSLESGIYLLSIKTGDKVFTSRVVKE